jgi:hypothetical protein
MVGEATSPKIPGPLGAHHQGSLFGREKLINGFMHSSYPRFALVTPGRNGIAILDDQLNWM